MIDDPALDQGIRKLPAAAAAVALIGLADAAYLSVKHFTEEAVPCSLLEGCETVLTSQFAELAGIPIAAFGAAAYFAAFALGVLGAYGSRAAWMLFGILSFAMAAFSVWLVYLQAFVINAFCQFCLISAATSLTLFAIYVASYVVDSRNSRPV